MGARLRRKNHCSAPQRRQGRNDAEIRRPASQDPAKRGCSRLPRVRWGKVCQLLPGWGGWIPGEPRGNYRGTPGVDLGVDWGGGDFSHSVISHLASSDWMTWVPVLLLPVNTTTICSQMISRSTQPGRSTVSKGMADGGSDKKRPKKGALSPDPYHPCSAWSREGRGRPHGHHTLAG